MAEELTLQQKQAVTDRGGNLLVSAAAGSGKTKVLVDRLLSYLTDANDPANLDDFLIITYTKAAAAELRGKIAAKLTERIALEPENRHLRQQMQRLYLTKISTVHAFCADILREYAYKMRIPVDFRVAEENECIELQARVLDKLLDEVYKSAEGNADFCELVNTQGLGRDDRQIPEIILKVYNSARCHLNPDAWLDWCLSVTDVAAVSDVSETVWGKYLIDDLHQYLDMQISALEKCAQKAAENGLLQKPVLLLQSTILQLKQLRSMDRWDEIIRYMDIDYGRLNFPRNFEDTDIVDQIKAVRENCKKGLAKKLRKFTDCNEQVLRDMQNVASAQRGLIALVRKFSEAYAKEKTCKRILDFSDLEQTMLDLLLGKNRSGDTVSAIEIGQRYREVMVDEYQDSNAVQDAIFAAITRKRQNCFMVGDVKQSIYQFRLADPTIFLDKYNAYIPADHARTDEGRKVLLSSNFRSSRSVINAVNDVFSTCMSVDVGGLDYGEDEALHEGIPHESLGEPEVELYAVDVQEDTYAEEAAFVAQRISQLLDGSHMVRDKEGLRPITPDDIVILLRSPGSVGGVYYHALEALGIRCATGAGTDLLHTEEVETLRALLAVLDNPLQDIPLISVLVSRMFCFNADELAAIRSERPWGSFYSALRVAQTDKARSTLKIIDQLRADARINSLPRLMQSVFRMTRLDSVFSSMTDGEKRVENLQCFYQLVCDADACGIRDLGRLTDYIAALEDSGAAQKDDRSVSGAVTIMSIHKSKGLEFPVVFLCGLSRDFNQESARAQILCDKDLGLGLSCVDGVNRVRYPSLAKRAIASKIVSESISEEMRVLYVAMTRPKDRLIMTYASRTLETNLRDMIARMDVSDKLLLTGDVDCPGKWVLLTALGRSEAGELFKLGGYPSKRNVHSDEWLIRVVQAPLVNNINDEITQEGLQISEEEVSNLQKIVSFHYPHVAATLTPSKQTATQLKGRLKDNEAAQDTEEQRKRMYTWRKPTFLEQKSSARSYGTAIHTIMQHISFHACTTVDYVKGEIARLVQAGYIDQDIADFVDAAAIAKFFTSELGVKVCQSDKVFREFKFSILDDAGRYGSDLSGERVLLQGVVDCAIIDDDGVTVIDFKSDRVTEDTLSEAVERYRMQVMVYASALERIFQLPIKSSFLYFFAIDQLVSL